MAMPNLEVVRRGGRRALWFPPRARSWVRGSADTTLWGNGQRSQIPGSRVPGLFSGPIRWRPCRASPRQARISAPRHGEHRALPVPFTNRQVVLHEPVVVQHAARVRRQRGSADLPVATADDQTGVHRRNLLPHRVEQRVVWRYRRVRTFECEPHEVHRACRRHVADHAWEVRPYKEWCLVPEAPSAPLEHGAWVQATRLVVAVEDNHGPLVGAAEAMNQVLDRVVAVGETADVLPDVH